MTSPLESLAWNTAHFPKRFIVKLNKFIYQDKLKETPGKGWGWIAAPNYEAKWNARMFIDSALKNNAKIINHAKVTKVLTVQ